MFRHFESDNMNCVWIVHLWDYSAFGIIIHAILSLLSILVTVLRHTNIKLTVFWSEISWSSRGSCPIVLAPSMPKNPVRLREAFTNIMRQTWDSLMMVEPITVIHGINYGFLPGFCLLLAGQPLRVQLSARDFNGMSPQSPCHVQWKAMNEASQLAFLLSTKFWKH